MDTASGPAFSPRSAALAIGAFLLEVLQIVIVAAAIVLPVRYFLIQPFNVKGASMEPNFHNDEYLIIDELSYRFREPVRGEVVVFRPPLDPGEYYIKRMIGLPGETVEITDGHVYISNADHPNRVELKEAYLDDLSTQGKKKVTLAADEYMVLGDNRDESLDSRSFGPIKRASIVGRAWVRGLPLSRVGLFEAPSYDL